MLFLLKLYDCISTWLKALPLCPISLEKNPLGVIEGGILYLPVHLWG